MRGLLTVPAGADMAAVIDLDRGWLLHPQVAVRPEPFGALLYHFGTRKLSFLKNRTILAVVQSAAAHETLRNALRGNGVGPADEPPYVHALDVLAASNMLVQRDSQ